MKTGMTWEQSVAEGLTYLERHDLVLRRLIKRYGPYRVQPHANYYHELASSIISQQLSVKAAATIEKRFMALFGDVFPTPEQIIATDVETLRGVGMSRPKASYIIDLASHVHDGRLELDKFSTMGNEDIIRELVAVKGVGEWTAHMFLMFALGRLDVLPVGDLGFRNGLKLNYGLDHAPSPAECRQIADSNKWHPYESIASWYMWQSLDNEPVMIG